MDMNDILTLAKAGFNAQQIAALSAVQSSVPNGVQQETVNNTTQVNQQTTANNTQLDQINQQLAALTGAMQVGNILTNNVPPVQTTDDILAEMIAPKLADNTKGGKK